MKLQLYSKVAFAMTILFFLFSSCSDDNTDNRTKLEYRIDAETTTNPILSVTYVGENGDEVTLPAGDASITTTDAMTIFSKTIRVSKPFAAHMTVQFRNNGDQNIPVMLSIVKNDIVALSDNQVIPANSNHEASIAYVMEAEE